jgi:hypothetical protein
VLALVLTKGLTCVDVLFGPQMFFDLGAYGVPQAVRDQKPWNAKKCIRDMEKYTRDVGGYQVRYTHTKRRPRPAEGRG